jgi:hypothetical protein
MDSVFDRWHPVTSDFGLIQAPIPTVLDAFQTWHAGLGIKYRRTEIGTSLADAFASLLPLANSKMRRLYVPTRFGWTACFQNGIQGSDPFPAMSTLAIQLGVLALRVCSTPPGTLHPATVLEVYAPPSLGGQPPLGYRRSIAALKDGVKWVFNESGEPFAFEDTRRYNRRLKRERFDRAMLERYLAHLGVTTLGDSMFALDVHSPAVALQQVTLVWHTPEFTLEEVIAGKPWPSVDSTGASVTQPSPALAQSTRRAPDR